MITCDEITKELLRALNDAANLKFESVKFDKRGKLESGTLTHTDKGKVISVSVNVTRREERGGDS